MIWSKLVWWVLWRGAVSGAILGGLFGTFIGFVVGTIYGMAYGAPIGAIMGVIDGIALAIMTYLFWGSPQPFTRFVLSTRILGMTLNFIGVYLYFHNSFQPPSVSFIPPILATIAAYFLAPRYVKYATNLYQSNNSRKPQVNVLS